MSQTLLKWRQHKYQRREHQHRLYKGWIMLRIYDGECGEVRPKITDSLYWSPPHLLLTLRQSSQSSLNYLHEKNTLQSLYSLPKIQKWQDIVYWKFYKIWRLWSVKNNLSHHMNDGAIEDVQESVSQFRLNKERRQFLLFVQVWKPTV